MMPLGGFDIRNLLTGHALAVLGIVLAALALLGILSLTFKGSIVV